MRNQSIYITLVLFIIAIAVLSSCNDQDEKADDGFLTVHPIEKNIPHHDSNHISIDADELDISDISLSDILIDLYKYLQNPAKFEQSSLEITVSGAQDVDISYLDSTTAVILDKRSDRFLLYELAANKTTSLAQTGRGPGDIAYTQEMVVYDSTIYIAMEDMRVSKFICQHDSCDYVNTIPIDYSAVSIAKIDNYTYAVLGQTVRQGNSDPKVDRKAVRIIDTNGNVIKSFGNFYETDDWIVLFSMRGGFIRYSEKQSKFILAYKHLPLLYIFDEALDITQTYKLEKYLQGEVLYNPALNAASPPRNDRTTIDKVELIDDNYLLIITTTTFENDEENESDTSYKFQQDYYAINLENNISYYFGEQKSDLKAVIYPTQKKLILNKGGMLYNIKPE